MFTRVTLIDDPCSPILIGALAIISTLSSFTDAFADEASDRDQTGKATKTLTDISLEDLPEPPGPVADLLSDGQVSFRYGPRELLGRDDRNVMTSRPRVLAGETQFQLKYIYSSRTRWRIDRKGGERELQIYVHYDSVKLMLSHDVWFRKQPPTETFWQNRLVRHELDHVRISTHPMIERTFRENVLETKEISKSLGKDEEATNALVRGIVEKRVQSEFDKIIDLVRIRYRELDRVTEHGLRPIPADSDSMKWINFNDPLVKD